MDETEKRIIQNEKDIALVAQRIDMHERECMEKHEAVIDQLKSNRKDLKDFRSNNTKWMIGILTSLVLGLILIVARMGAS